MDDIDTLISRERTSVERFVKFKICIKEDAEDILQEVFITAMKTFHQLKNKASFKAWIISIARNKCNDYFRNKAHEFDIPVEELLETKILTSRYGITESLAVGETIEKLGAKDKQILYLYFWKEMPQEEIAQKLNIPVGTVKSRLYTAKQKFRQAYAEEDICLNRKGC